MEHELNVAFGFDGHFAAHAATTIASIIRHAPSAAIHFIILFTDVDTQRRANVEKVAPNSRFTWIEVTDSDLPPFSQRDHLNRSTLFRLGLEKLAPKNCRRILYLDSDLIVLRDICELWHTDLRGYPIGAVVDGFVDPEAFARRWHLPFPARYFNAGVLLINLEEVRAKHVFSTAIELIVKQGDNFKYNDQDALNLALWNCWHRLDVAWNVQRSMTIPSLIAEIGEDRRLNGRAPRIVHYTTEEKPWLLESYHPWAWIYWKSLQLTPFFNEVAQRNRIGHMARLRLWLRWLRRRPSVRIKV